MTSRAKIATELLRDCPAESLADHQAIAQMLRKGRPAQEILDSPECQRWPETYSWLKGELAPVGRPLTLPGPIGELARIIGLDTLRGLLGGVAPSTVRRWANEEIQIGAPAQMLLDQLYGQHDLLYHICARHEAFEDSGSRLFRGTLDQAKAAAREIQRDGGYGWVAVVRRGTDGTVLAVRQPGESSEWESGQYA